MGKWYCGIGLAIGALAVAGCVEQRSPLDPSQATALLLSGVAPLTCREACLAEWRQNQPAAAQLDAARRWQELAALVLGINYQDDLSLYYLGRAAEGLGYPAAAAGYYRQSMRFSGTSGSCEALSRLCGGVALPRAASVRVAAIDRDLNAPRRRRGAPAPARRLGSGGLPSEAAEPLPAEAPPSLTGGVAMPTEAPSEPPPPAREPPRTAAGIAMPAPPSPGAAPSDFIEPPPAAAR